MLARYYTNSLWTIIRPGGLLNDAPSGAAALTEDTSVLGSVSRADVADLVVRQLDSEATFKKARRARAPRDNGRGAHRRRIVVAVVRVVVAWFCRRSGGRVT